MSRFGSLADAPASLLIHGARVVDPATGTDAVADLALHDGAFVEPAAVPAGAVRVDADGLLAIPALCDLHAHLREPGGEASETIESGARAAAHGGYATVCAMPNTDPPLDEPARVALVVARAARAACRVRVIAAATRGRAGEALTDLGELAGLGIAGGCLPTSPRSGCRSSSTPRSPAWRTARSCAQGRSPRGSGWPVGRRRRS